MKRALIIIAVLVVVVAGGVGAFWYVNQGKARDQILMALEQLDRAGVDTEYETLSITGFPFAYGGRFENLKATIPARGLALELPSATAGMSVGSIGTVDFDLPETFFVTVTEGESAGERLQVESEALIASVAPGAEKVYDLGMTADRVRLSAPEDADDYIEIWSLVVEGALAASDQAGRLDAEFSAASATFSVSTPAQNGAEAGTTKLTAETVSGVVAGDLKALEATVASDAMSVDAGAAGLMTLSGLELALKATPQDQFDAEAMFSDPTSEGAIARIVAAAMTGVVDGGAFNGAFSVTKIQGSISAEIEGQKQAVAIDSDNLRYGADLSPELIGFSLAADRMKLDVTGSEDFSYDVSGMEMALKTEAQDGFALGPLLGATTPDERGAMLMEIIRSEIVKGGKAELSFASTSAESDSTLEIPDVPLQRLKARSGPTTSVISLDAEAARIDARGEDLHYEAEGAGLAGAGDVGAAVFEAAFPLKAADETQQATLLYDIDTIALDEQIWSLLDPEGKLSHDMRGIRIDAALDMVVAEDLLSAPAALIAPPISFDKVAVNEVLVDLIGFHAEAEGAVALSPAPAGEVTVMLRDWSAFLESASAVPMAQDPQVQTMLLIAAQWVEDFGVPGDSPELTKLAVTLGEDGAVTVNGKPLQPPAGAGAAPDQAQPGAEQPVDPAQ